MLSSFSSIICDVREYLSASSQPLEDFKNHWNQIILYFTNEASKFKVSVENAALPYHLQCMSAILIQEQEVLPEVNDFGPCLEYFLQHKLPSSLCAFAVTDTPPGMRNQMFMFFKNLLTKSKHSLIDQMSIYNSILELIQLCGEKVASSSEIEEMEFLDFFCKYLKQRPHLIERFFIVEQLHFKFRNLQSEEINTAGSTKYVNIPLINSLLTHLQSPDGKVQSKAGMNILLCASIVNDLSAKSIVEHTKLVEILIENLIEAYFSIPEIVDLEELRCMDIKWDYVSSSYSLNAQISLPVRKVIFFMVWFDLFNNLIAQSNHIIGVHILNMLNQEFLETILLFDLIGNRTVTNYLTTSKIVTCCLRYSTCANVKNLILHFFLKDFHIGGIVENVSGSILDVLIKRCQDVEDNYDLVIYTLHLFGQILENPTESFLNHLVIDKIKTRSCFDTSIDYSPSNSDGDKDIFNMKEENKKVSLETNAFFVHNIIEYFLNFVPEDIKSGNSDESSFEAYIAENYEQYRSYVIMCQPWHWPKKTTKVCSNRITNSSRGDANQFDEGLFIKMLLTNLEHIFELPYDIVLSVTSLISRIALLPHPSLTEFFLNPLLQFKSDIKSLICILWVIVNKLDNESSSIPEIKQKLKLMRLNNLDNTCETGIPHSDARILKRIILIEEFCKELAAITFVKYYFESEHVLDIK